MVRIGWAAKVAVGGIAVLAVALGTARRYRRFMCGISVLLDPAGSPRFASRLLAMHAVIRHRGPDGEGFLVVDETARFDAFGGGRTTGRAGHVPRRLCVPAAEDLRSQRGGQSADGQRRPEDLAGVQRRDLQLPRTSCRTGSAGPCIPHPRRHRGGARRLSSNGANAASSVSTACGRIVILDLRRNRLVVSRDRFGIKPVYWKIDKTGRCCSPPRSSRSSRQPTESRRQSNRPLIAAFLRGFRYPTLEETFFEGIRSVPPASWCEIDLAVPAGAALPALLESCRLHCRKSMRCPTMRPLRAWKICWRAPSLRIARPM